MSAISCASRDADASKATLETGPLSSELTLKLETLVSPVPFSACIAFIVIRACLGTESVRPRSKGTRKAEGSNGEDAEGKVQDLGQDTNVHTRQDGASRRSDCRSSKGPEKCTYWHQRSCTNRQAMYGGYLTPARPPGLEPPSRNGCECLANAPSSTIGGMKEPSHGNYGVSTGAI